MSYHDCFYGVSEERLSSFKEYMNKECSFINWEDCVINVRSFGSPERHYICFTFVQNIPEIIKAIVAFMQIDGESVEEDINGEVYSHYKDGWIFAYNKKEGFRKSGHWIKVDEEFKCLQPISLNDLFNMKIISTI